MTAVVRKRGEYKQKGKKLWMRLFSVKGLSALILAMALLKAIVELATVIASLFH